MSSPKSLIPGAPALGAGPGAPVPVPTDDCAPPAPGAICTTIGLERAVRYWCDAVSKNTNGTEGMVISPEAVGIRTVLNTLEPDTSPSFLSILVAALASKVRKFVSGGMVKSGRDLMLPRPVMVSVSVMA